MKKLIKQWFCKHLSIDTTTEATIDNIYMVKTIIKCMDCEKTFALHPHAHCCYVQHLHAEILRENYFRSLGIKVTHGGGMYHTPQSYYSRTQSNEQNDTHREVNK